MTDDLAGSKFARSFGAEATRYGQVRPGYPADAIDFALSAQGETSSAGTVLDLGAGTGKLTQLLTGRAGRVLAVEPDPEMRAVMGAAAPQAEALDGSAERIPLPDASVDVITVGQAFHWFARPAADHEMARVLRPGGWASLIWNFPDRSVEWVRRLYQATRDPEPPGAGTTGDLDIGLFTEPEEFWTAWQHELAGPGALRDLVHTWSWVITRSEPDRAMIDRRLQILTNQFAELQGPAIRFPYRTKVVRQSKR